MHHSTDRMTHTTDFVTPVVQVLTQAKNSLMGPQSRIDPTAHRTISERFTTERATSFLLMTPTVNFKVGDMTVLIYQLISKIGYCMFDKDKYMG